MTQFVQRISVLTFAFLLIGGIHLCAEEPTSSQVIAELAGYLEQPASERGPIADQLFADVALDEQDAQTAAKMLWDDHRKQIIATRTEEMKACCLTDGDLQMRFYATVSGDRPKEGRSLYISMHGGGGAPARVNDQQWENQKRLYQLDEGVYVAPRAPTDTWNLWHQGHIDAFFDRLIENMVVFAGVNPNRVYLMGYSAGGDGVYQLAPRMADRFAAASMMAGHPNEASPLGLRNLSFTIHVGAQDGGYNRNKIAGQWGEKLDQLQDVDPDGYVHWTKLHEGKGHWMDRQDAEALPWMAKHTRDPLPSRIVWRQDDVTHSRFYWLAVEADDQHKGNEVRADLEGQQVILDTDDLRQVIVRFNDGMLDMDKDVVIKTGDDVLFSGRVDRTIGVIAKTLEERGDPVSLFSGEVTVSLPEKP